MKPTRRKSPQARKQAEYDLDHHSPSAHGLRKNWAKFKATPVRAERREASLKSLAVLKAAADPSTRENLEVRVFPHRRRPRKDLIISVREKVEAQAEARIWLTGYDLYFSRRYDSASHRTPFVAFLASLTRGRSVHAHRVASYFRAALNAPASRSGSVSACAARFLRAFGRDEPAVFQRFLSWLERLDGTEGPPNPSLQRTRYARR